MRGSMRASPASSTVCSTCRSDRRTRMSSGRSAVPDCGPPAGDVALDLCTAPALEPLRPILAVRLDEDAGDGMDEVGVRRHVVLPCRKVAPCRLDGSPPNPSEVPSARSPRLRTAARRAYDPRCGTRDAPVRRVVEREQREPRKRCRDANTRRPKERGRPFGGRGTTVEQETGWPAKVRFSVRRRPERRDP